MATVDIISKVIKLAEASDAEDRGIAERLGVALPGGGIVRMNLKEPRALQYSAADRPSRAKLEGYLQTLPGDVVFKLQTLMYVGRDKDVFRDAPEIRALHRHMIETCGSDARTAIATMMGKRPLAEFLAEGLSLAQKNLVDLEGPS